MAKKNVSNANASDCIEATKVNQENYEKNVISDFSKSIVEWIVNNNPTISEVILKLKKEVINDR